MIEHPAQTVVRRRRVVNSGGMVRAAVEPAWIEGFVLFQIACQLALLLPMLGPLRIFLRTGAFAASLLLLLALPKRGRVHPAAYAAAAVVAIVAMGIFHPYRNTLTSAIAQVLMYAAILAPLVWVTRLRVDVARFERLVLILWSFHAASAATGMLQMYFPGQFEPSLSTVIGAREQGYIDSLKIELPNGQRVFRPMGLTDQPGGAAASGFYTLMLGISLAMTRRGWLRPAALLSMPLGLFCLYLSQVRSTLIMALICMIVFMALMAWRGEFQRVIGMVGIVGAVVLLSFAWAFSVGGEVVTKRLFTLIEDDPGKVYHENRGRFLESTIKDLLPEAPLGAGLGRWGMMNYYFGDNDSDPNRAAIWAEIQWTAWVLDGGIPLVLAYVTAIGIAFYVVWRIAMDRTCGALGIWGAMLFGYNTGALAVTFNNPIFLAQAGLEFWLINAALFAAYWEGRRQKTEDRSQEPEVRSQKTEDRRQEADEGTQWGAMQ